LGARPRPPKPDAPKWADHADFDRVYGWAEAHFPPAPAAAAFHGRTGVRPVTGGY
jgi:hypothetical protein